MKITSLKEAETILRDDGVSMTDFFSPENTGGKVSMGHAVFPAGTVTSWASHDGDEYSFILDGEVTCETIEEGVCSFSSGGACFIPAGQNHCSRNDSNSDASVLWILIEKN